MIIGLFEVQNTIGVTMTNYVKILLDSFGLLDKVIVYAQDESSNLNMLTNALKSIVSCFPLILHAPFVGLCLTMQCERQFNMPLMMQKFVKVF